MVYPARLNYFRFPLYQIFIISLSDLYITALTFRRGHNFMKEG